LSRFEREWSVVVVDPAARAALLARLVVAECLGFLVQERGPQALRQFSGNDSSELLHVQEVHPLVGPDLVGGTLSSDFPPADGQLTKPTKKLRRSLE
jgi:hypothetical protein